MKINVNKNNIKYIFENGEAGVVDMGQEEIHNHGFEAVDHVVDILTHKIREVNLEKSEGITVFGNTIEAKMVQRKLEDKMKIEINFDDEGEVSL